MKPRVGSIVLSTLGLAACGGGGDRVSIRGDFADSASAATVVRAVEAAREAEVKGAAFELDGLSGGPATLRLVRGADTSATLALDNAPAGAAVVLHGVRTDARSGRAFPRSVELSGAELLLVNGVRMGDDARLPAEVDAHGRILALTDERDALLVRPDDETLPDLRVVMGLATRTVDASGDSVDPASLTRGDSVRVKGRVDNGFIVAEQVTVPRRLALAAGTRGESPSSPESRPTSSAESSPAPKAVERTVSAVAAPVVVSPSALRRVGPRPAAAEPRRHGRGRGGGRGRGKGRKG